MPYKQSLAKKVALSRISKRLEKCVKMRGFPRFVDFKLTLKELAGRTGLSRAALGKYEADEAEKDISSFAILTLAKFYGVSTDYLLGLTENKNHPNTELNAMHLSDDAITVLTSTTGCFLK